jgi:hypothetical protein
MSNSNSCFIKPCVHHVPESWPGGGPGNVLQSLIEPVACFLVQQHLSSIHISCPTLAEVQLLNYILYTRTYMLHFPLIIILAALLISLLAAKTFTLSIAFNIIH